MIVRLLVGLCPLVWALASGAEAHPGETASQVNGLEGVEADAALPVKAPLVMAQAETTDASDAPEGLDAPLPTILRDAAELPEPVRAMRQQLLDAAKTGALEELRPLMEAQPEPPAVALSDPGDPIEYFRALAADAEGREILAILLEVLRAGAVHVGAGTEQELYVWPYFAEFPLEALTPEQLVELFTLLTATDFEDMKSYGAYTFFRVGIAPDGRWLFFLAGD